MKAPKSSIALAVIDSTKASQIEEAAGFLLIRCINRITDAMDKSMAEHDLNTQQFGVLHSVFRERASTPSALARLRFTNSAAITYTLDVLEKKALLNRKRSATDRRVIELELTAKGKDLIQVCIPKAIAAQEEVLHPLSGADCQVLHTLLKRIATAGDGGENTA